MAKVTKRQRTKVEKALDKFLAERRVSDGGYAPVTKEDMEQLDALVYEIVQAKCGADPDGDWPIECTFVNRNTHERLHYYPIPYGHKLKNFEALRDRISRLMTNLDMAQGAVSQMMRSFMDYDMPRIGLTYQNWYMGGHPPRQCGHYWTRSKTLFKGSQVVEVTYGRSTGLSLVVRIPGRDDTVPLKEITQWGPQVLGYSGGPLPWGKDEE